MTALQKTLIATALVVATGTGIYEAREISQLRNLVQSLTAQPAPFAEQRQKLLLELDDATNRLSALYAEMAQLKSVQPGSTNDHQQVSEQHKQQDQSGQPESQIPQENKPSKP